jgi:hypothetical protein
LKSIPPSSLSWLTSAPACRRRIVADRGSSY